jgi:hypothetical protein
MAQGGWPYRARAVQVVLGVGAVLVVIAGIAVVNGSGAVAARFLLLGLAAGVAGGSVIAAAADLRNTEETLALCAAALGLVAAWADGPTGAISAGTLAGVCLALRVLVGSAGWSLAAWTALQIAALRVAGSVPDGLHPYLFLGVALVGLGVALGGRPLVARFGLVTTVPWWVAGVLGGTTTAWSGDGVGRHLAAAVVVAAAAGLLPVRLRQELDRLTGPRYALPALSGAVAGIGVAGSLAAFDTPGIWVAGYAGVLVATVVPEFLDGWPRRFLGPVMSAAGLVLVATALVQLSLRSSWAGLALLFLLTAVPAGLVAWREPAERPGSLPWAVGCVAAAGVFAVPAGWLDRLPAGLALAVLYALALTASLTMPEAGRRATLRMAVATAAAGVVLVALDGDRAGVALVLVVQAAATIGWAWWTGPPAPDAPTWAAWRAGAAELVAAAWLTVSTGEVHVLEGYTVPLAAGLLIAQGPKLAGGPSWSAWGPGLLVALVPSAVQAVVLDADLRPWLVFAGAVAAMVLGAAWGYRAPIVIGALTAIGTGLALALATVVWAPVAAMLATGILLLGAGAGRELFPTPSFAARLADLR